MSIFFQVGDRVVWNPSNGVARLFLSMTEAAESHVGMEAGFSGVMSDEVMVDRQKLCEFREKLMQVEHKVSAHLFAGYLDCLEVIEGRARMDDVEAGQRALEIAKSMAI